MNTTWAAGGAPGRVTRRTARPALVGAGRRLSRQALVFLPAVLLVVTLLKAFVIGVFFIPSESMEPLLSPGDRILVNLWERPERGDVIVFDGAGSFTPAGTPTTFLGSGPVQVALGIDPRTLFVKRATYWVMGDHRDDSADSRARADGPTHGFVPESAIQGALR